MWGRGGIAIMIAVPLVGPGWPMAGQGDVRATAGVTGCNVLSHAKWSSASRGLTSCNRYQSVAFRISPDQQCSTRIRSAPRPQMGPQTRRSTFAAPRPEHGAINIRFVAAATKPCVIAETEAPNAAFRDRCRAAANIEVAMATGDWASLALHRDVWRGVVSRC